MKTFIQILGAIFSYIYPDKINDIIYSIKLNIYTGYKKKLFKSFGKNSVLCPYLRMLIGCKYIEIGEKCIIGSNVQLTAYDCYENQRFTPHLIINDGVEIGDGSHITCINKIIIGKNVLTGRNVLITDNSHGGGSELREYLDIPPAKRKMYTKGIVEIGDNVWICEKVSIMSNVKIGKGSIIGANTVITKDVPEFTLAVGSPVRYIKLR